MKNYLIEIDKDVLDIVSEIKRIDAKYKVFFNVKKNRFELYSQKGLNLDLELVCEQQKLDNRFLIKVKRTRLENAQKYLLEVERENKKLQDDFNSKLLDETQTKAKEMFSYADNKNQDIDFSSAYKTQWV